MAVRAAPADPSTDTVLLPFALADGLLFGGLTAPTMRATLVLLSTLTPGGAVEMRKPVLERLSGTRIDNGERFLNRPRECTIDGGTPDDGEPWFAELEYEPGVIKKLAGTITGRLTRAARETLADPRWGNRKVLISAGVLGQLSTVPGILLYLRLAGILSEHPAAKVVDLRLDAAAIERTFGSYSSPALQRGGKRPTVGRSFDVLIAPAVRDITEAFGSEWSVEATPVRPAAHRQGKAWSHVEVRVRRVERLTMKQLAAEQAKREAYKAALPGYLKSRASDPSNSKKAVVED